MDKNYNSAAVSMSEFSEVTSTAEDLKYKNKPKPFFRTWDQTLNDVETMACLLSLFQAITTNKQQTFQQKTNTNMLS